MKASAIFFTATLASVGIGVDAQGATHSTWTGLRGAQFNRRVAETEAPQQTPTRYCDSIGCPNKYVPIADARNVECSGGECEVEQCCMLLCSSFACIAAPPIPFADMIMCQNGVCTQEQCCDGGTHSTEEPQTHDDSCLSYECPTGFTTIDNAASKKCKHGSDEDYGIFSYSLGDGAPSYDFSFDDDSFDGAPSYSFGDEAPSYNLSFGDDDFDGAPSYDFSFDDDFDAAPSYGFWFDDLDSLKLDTTAISTGGRRRTLRSAVAKSSLKINNFAVTSSTSPSSSEDFCDTPTCCRQLEYGLWGPE